MRAVAGSDVLLEVSQTLQNRLTAGLSALGPPGPVAELHDLQRPAVRRPAAGDAVPLRHRRGARACATRPRPSELVGGRLVERKQPLALCLHYLVTAWGGDRRTEQQLLGRVMQLLLRRRDPRRPRPARRAGRHRRASCGSASSPMQLEDRARVWWAIGQPYRLSVNYEVRVVDIDAIGTRSSHPGLERATSRRGCADDASASSPAWSTGSRRARCGCACVDTFTGAPPDGPRRGAPGAPGAARTGCRFELPHQYKSSGDLALRRPRPGRTRAGPARPSTSASLSPSPRTVVRDLGGRRHRRRHGHHLGRRAPAGPARPRTSSRCYPAPDYRFRPALPLLAGQVVDAAGDPVAARPGRRHRDRAGQPRRRGGPHRRRTAGSASRCAGPRQHHPSTPSRARAPAPPPSPCRPTWVGLTSSRSA